MARRKTEVFSMSFLDCITCAFGSVVLVYTLINARGGLRHTAETQTVRQEVSQLEQQVLDGYQALLVLRNDMQQTDEERARTEGLAPRVVSEIERTKLQLADADKETVARREAIERLKADLKSLDEGRRRLEGGTRSPGALGTSLRGFEGEGQRHYLTGLKVGGERVMLLVDTSASMLDETLVNILRMRNMSDARKRLSEKWHRTISIAEWLTAHIPETSKFQIYAFNTHAWAVLPGSDGKWLDGNDVNALNGSLKGLRELAPKDGTSLENAFTAMNALSPPPDRIILTLRDELIDIETQREALGVDLKGRKQQLSDVKARVARLQGDLSSLRGEFAASRKDSDAVNEIQGRLVAAQETLTQEMKRLYAGAEFKRQKGDIVGGVPIDSEYVIFIIDTSGSMFNYAWPMMLESMQEILNIYPHLKGFQVTNDQGTHMFPSYQGKWITDSPSQRKMVLDRLRTWNPFSASNPSRGIIEAIRTYWAKDKKISLYVLGDEFTGDSIESVVKAVDLVNHADETGERRVRIHAIGFPVTPAAPQYTSIRLAALMRIICQRNGGTFVGMHEAESRGPKFRVSAVDPPRDRTGSVAATLASMPGSARGAARSGSERHGLSADPRD